MLDSPVPSDMSLGLRSAIHLIDRLDMLVVWREAWQKLVAAAARYPLYLTYDYVELVAANMLMQGGTFVLIIVSNEAGIQALFPVTIKPFWTWRVAETMTCGNGEEYGEMLLAASAGQAVIDRAMLALRRIPADVLIMPYLEEQGWMQRALEKPTLPWLIPDRVGRRHGHSIKLRDTSLDAYWQSRSAMLRRNLKRYAKQLSSQGKVEIGWCADPRETDRVLTWIFDTKRRWAKARNIKTQYLWDTKLRDFMIVLANRLDLGKTPLVACVKVNGQPVAGMIMLVGSHVTEAFLSTYDEAFYRYSPSVLLQEFLVNWAHGRNLDFDFGFYHSEYKGKWSNTRTDHRTQYVILSPYGRLMELQIIGKVTVEKLVHVQKKLRELCTRANFRQGIAKLRAKLPRRRTVQPVLAVTKPISETVEAA